MTLAFRLLSVRPARRSSAGKSPVMPLLALAAAIGAPVAQADAPVDSLGDAVAGGKTSLELRYRYENVAQDGFTEDANASTLRTRLRYSTAEWMSTTALVEFDNVSSIGYDEYNDTRNGKTQYPLVVDPTGSELNQAYFKYVGIGNTVLSAGRQRVNLDNQRFIGSVGWRQNEQSMDGGLVEFKGIDRLTATYGYITKVNRIYGPVNIPGATTSQFDGHSQLANLKYVVGEPLTVVAYDYFLDLADAPTLSSKTAGLRLTGKVPVGALKFGYTAEYAEQSNYKKDPASYRAPYQLAELTLGGAAGSATWEAQAGFERLGQDDGIAVQTPLATLHRFQGWADKFLTTPSVGLIDSYAGGTVTVQGTAFTLVGHAYKGDENAADYGKEIDAQVSKTFLKRYTAALKYADYRQGNVAAVNDTIKTWVTLEAKF